MVTLPGPRFLVNEKDAVRPTVFFHSLSRAAGLSVAAVGALVLGGWAFEIHALTSVLPGLASMKVNTALAFVLAGMSLFLLARDKPPPARQRAAILCSSLVALLGLLTIVEYLSGRGLGIDEILFRDVSTDAQVAAPGRMAPATALSFLMIGTALVLLEHGRGRWAAQFLALGTALVSLLALMGYAYGVRGLYQVLPFTSVAMHTAISLAVLSAGVFFARPRDGLMEIVTNHGAGGAVARRLLPAALLVPFLLGWLRLQGQRLGLFGTEFGLALFALSNIIIFSVLIWWHAGRLHRAGLEIRRMIVGLREAHDTLRALVDASPVAMVSIDSGGRVATWNRCAEQMFGWTQQEVLGGPLPIGQDADGDLIRGVIERGERIRNVEVARRRKDGSGIEISLSAAPLFDAHGQVRGGMAVLADISERRSLEQQVRQSQKLEAVGRLAGGIAHDFNNLLTVIGGTTELMLARLPQSSPLLRNAEEVHKAAVRAGSLTQQLLAFSRKQVMEPRVLDLNGIASGMEKMLRRLIGEDIALSFSCAEDLGRVKVDPGQIEQVIMNLAVNARDAMPSGGRLMIETRNVTLDEAYAGRHISVRPGPYVMLAATDTGIGMPPDVQARVFEPFFTTKGPGKGTGLGLSTVYGIVKQSGGYIWVYSEPGRGTTFKVYLPRVEEEADRRGDEEAGEVPVGNETILLVEDEEMVRMVARRMLEKAGYTVIEASGGREALDLLERHPGAIDLLITDVVMPQMNGRQLAGQAGLLRSDMKVLFISGYTDHAIVRSGMLEEGLAFLHKPFSYQAFARKVRETLEGPAGTGRPI